MTITAAEYLDAGIFARELEQCFHARWTYACCAAEVPAHNDYVVRTVGAKSVFIQNVHGELRAFSNVCPHRFSQLRDKPCGNGAIRCPYHRWTFDGDGALVGVPLASEFAHIRHHDGTWNPSLERWQLARCGELVFVALAPAQTLEAALGTDHARLTSLGAAFAQPILHTELPIAANWKIAMQNTLEFYHAASVHPDTFAPYTPKQPILVDEHAVAPNLSYVSLFEAPLLGRRDRGVSARLEQALARRPIRDLRGYSHYLAFPNTTFGTTDGRSFAIFRYVPVDVSTTRLEIHLLASVVQASSRYARELIEWSYGTVVAVTLRLAGEDRAICEAVQRGLRSSPPGWAGVTGAGEHFVEQWQQRYRDAMTADSTGSATSGSGPRSP